MAQLAIDAKATRTAAIIAHAAVALDGQENAMSWLQKPNPHLDSKTPLEVLFSGTADEVETVDELLSAMENGMYV
jgi:uncharacterized protein (DUF2384 family)